MPDLSYCLGRYFTSRNAISILSFEHCRNVSPVNTIMAPKWVDLRHSLLQKLVADFCTIMQIIISLLGKVYNHTPIIKHHFDFPDKKRFKELQLKMHFFLLHHYSFFTIHINFLNQMHLIFIFLGLGKLKGYYEIFHQYKNF